MSHMLLTDPRLFQFLQKIDADTLASVGAQPCPCCDSKLDRADYPRKPRGLPSEVEAEFSRRPSFCCRADGCRSRQTPVLLAFLDRRVYVSAVVVLIAAMQQGPTPARMEKLRQAIGVSPRTVRRWLAWWREVFPHTEVWRRVSGMVVPSIDETRLPSSLLARLAALGLDDFDGLTSLLRLLIS